MIRESAPEPFVDDETEFTFQNGQIVRMAKPTHLEPCECGGPLHIPETTEAIREFCGTATKLLARVDRLIDTNEKIAEVMLVLVKQLNPLGG